MAASSPAAALLLRTKDAVAMTTFSVGAAAAPVDTTIKADFDAGFAHTAFSLDGRLAAITDKDGVDVFDVAVNPAVLKLRIAQPNVSAVAFSPAGTFLLTWHRKREEEANLVLWATADGAQRTAWHHRSNAAELWPPIRWSGDESIAIRAGNDEIHVYHGGFPTTDILHRLRCPGVQQAWVSAGGGAAGGQHTIAGFAPRNKSKPASAVIWAYPKVAEPSLARSLQADGARVDFSPDGCHALFELSTSASADSYYGDSRLFLASRDGRLNLAVAHPKEGPIHDFAWSPNSDSFIVIGGKSPPVAALYSKTGALLHNFGAAAFNTIRFSPNGRIVMLAGFGNMSGNIVFYDVSSKKPLGPTANSQCVVSSEWSPDSRYLLTSTTRPRLQVDNGYKVWDYHGRCLFSRPFDQLFGATWRPAPRSAFPDRAPSPPPKEGSPAAGAAAAGGSASPASAGGAPAKPAGAYRPPGARGVPGGGLVASMMQERFGEGSPLPTGHTTALPSLRPGGGPPGPSGLPIGAAPVQLSASQKKRLKAKAKKDGGGKGGAGGGSGKDEEDEGEGGEEGGEGEAAAAGGAAAAGQGWQDDAPAPAPASSAAGGRASASAGAGASAAPATGEARYDGMLSADEARKQLKKLSKKLTEIAELKAKAAAGTALDEAQQAKVGGEKELTDRMARLQVIADSAPAPA